MTMRLDVAHYGFLALAAMAIAGCSSDIATAPNARAIQPRGPASDLVDLTSTPALYYQVATSDESDGFGATADTTYLADDFVVPAGAVWTVTDVGITGALHFNGFRLKWGGVVSTASPRWLVLRPGRQRRRPSGSALVSRRVRARTAIGRS